MGRVLAVFLLSLSLTAYAQNSSQQTSTIPAHVNLDPAPAVVYGASTPINVMTPPMPNDSSAVVGDYRVATPMVPAGPPPSVVLPNAGASATTSSVTGTSAPGAAASVGSFSFSSEVPQPASSSSSVADAASQYRINKGTTKSRVIDNSTLGTLDKNPSGLVTTTELTMPQSDVDSEAAPPSNAKPEYAASGDTLDPRDLAAVEAAVRRSQAGSEGTEAGKNTQSGAQYEQMTREGEQQLAQNQADASGQPAAAAAASRAEAPQEQSQARSSEKKTEQLPESSSALPFVALLGLLSLAGGAISVLRSRA